MVRLPVVAAFAVLALGVPLAAAAADDLGPAPPSKAALVHHAVSTQNADAQAKFDEGLTLIYAFNRDEAARRFAAAAQADPTLAMAWWGVALANGPNLNFGMTAERVAAAAAALAKAKALENGASAQERAYIDALALRYPAVYVSEEASKRGYVAYRDAMAKVHAAYSDDPDAATLYVESVMDVEEWGWDGTTARGTTASLVAILEDVIAKNPDHPGANHYLVHLMDHTGIAERALPSAEALSALPVEPAASHLQHMSGHNYLDNGLFAPLERDNRSAVDNDRRYAASLNEAPAKLDYFYHNLDFYLGGTLMLDDRSETERAAEVERAQGDPVFSVLASLRERRFDEVIASPKPAPRRTSVLLWTYARGVAFASRGDIRAARAALATLDATVAASNGRTKFYAQQLDALLGARVADAEGDDATAIARLRSVVAAVANIPPEVFAPWYFPTGEWLGAFLLKSGDVAGAEAAFRADLGRTPHNARALYGLMQTFTREGRLDQARALAPEIAANWRGPYEDLRLEQ